VIIKAERLKQRLHPRTRRPHDDHGITGQLVELQRNSALLLPGLDFLIYLACECWIRADVTDDLSSAVAKSQLEIPLAVHAASVLVGAIAPTSQELRLFSRETAKSAGAKFKSAKQVRARLGFVSCIATASVPPADISCAS
jgi:hypothetical protein